MRPKRSAPRRRLTDGEKQELLYGFALSGEIGFADNEEARRRAWAEHRDDLMLEWLSEERHAGSRPDAFWEFEAREPRRVKCYIEDGYNLKTGLPYTIVSEPTDKSKPLLESKTEYLERLGLMSQRELEIVAKRALKMQGKPPLCIVK